MGISTDTIENLEWDPILISNVFRFNTFNKQLDLVPSTQICAKASVHFFIGLPGVHIVRKVRVVSRAPNSQLHNLERSIPCT